LDFDKKLKTQKNKKEQIPAIKLPLNENKEPFII
jgi:hypothetical protein